MNSTSVDSYLAEGCGRCDKFQTPDCKVHLWTGPLTALRQILQETVLDEEMKWGSPCYTLGGKNVILLGSFKEYCAISFLKGVALDDVDGVLEKPGPNSRYARIIKFQSREDVDGMHEPLVRLIEEAIEVERSGKEVEPEGELEPMPEEMQDRFATDDELRGAFDRLTPGRQRSHILYVSGAKQAETRENRVERCIPKIYAGKGYNER